MGEGKRVKFQIWDTNGEERFRAVRDNYFRGKNAMMLIYDVTYRESFHRILYWLMEIKTHAQLAHHVILIGKKTNLVNEREVSTEEGRARAKQLNIETFIETSIKTGDGFDVLEDALVSQTIKLKHSEKPWWG